MIKEIKALPDKQPDIDLNFELRTKARRSPYKMKIRAQDMESDCIVQRRKTRTRTLHFHSKKDSSNLQKFFCTTHEIQFDWQNYPPK